MKASFGVDRLRHALLGGEASSGAVPDKQTAGLEGEVDACLAALPVVARQLDETRGQIESAVVEVCQSFQGIAARANSSVAEARQILGDGSQAGGVGFDGTLEAMRSTFDRLLVRMGEGLERAREAGGRMQRINDAVGKIETILAEVEGIALSTRLLTINAKIQASHAGIHGRGFVVIAEAISELSSKSDSIVGQVRENLAAVVGAVDGAGEELSKLTDTSDSAVQESQSEIHGALDLVRRVYGETQAGLERATRSGDELAGEIHRAVTAMQFQDRVSQRIEHLSTALQGMVAALGERRHGRAPDAPRDHLAELEKSYTMAEEHAGPAAGGSDDVVLF